VLTLSKKCSFVSYKLKNHSMTEASPKVLIVYTGGTIGMINDLETGELKAVDFNYIHKHVPEISRLNVQLSTLSVEHPIDSSEMHPEHWVKMATIIAENYANYDGFVILHGSDTMAFSSSALSFMLQGLRKPVIFTGSQLPIGTIRTDGKENLITSIEIAAQKDAHGEAIVQEVAVYFEYSLYRGNRSSKISANQFEAFSSPNYNELAKAGVNIEYNLTKLYRTNLPELVFFPVLDTRIGLLKIYPGFPIQAYKSLFDNAATSALVIETFGSGNAPSDTLFRSYITHYIAKGGLVVNVTQCSSGAVQQGKYATSSFFNKAGVVSGKDLTTEAALAKLMHLVGRGLSQVEIKKAFETAICGESM
jgi:L-asparaginase